VFQRDRDRIIHSTAFRLMEYKTQVFVTHEDDKFRTRLTHTLEVAQIARSICRRLRLNEDLTEAIALAHDLGHTPFGHSGEKALHELMLKHGGFEHNRQSLRIVEVLEERYPNFPGLNLTPEVREGIAKHRTDYDQPGKSRSGADRPSLEAQLVNLADEIAYNSHDLDDGLASGLLNLESLSGVSIWKSILQELGPALDGVDETIRKYQCIRRLIDLLCGDLAEQTEKNLARHKPASVDDVRKCPENLVGFSPAMGRQVDQLKTFLLNNLYRHYRVVRMEDKARRIIKDIFEVYAERPDVLPPKIQARMKDTDKERVICDYIAGMTDRLAQEEYKKLFDPLEKV
jgi:dGTPase